MARVKVVKGTDGRTWTVRRQMLFRMPAIGDDFEHDVAGGTVGVYVILGMLALFYVALLSWWSTEVHVPAWVKIAGFIVILFFPARWFLRRPWQLTAQTPGLYDPDRREGTKDERWVGTVRGMTKAREETGMVIRSIRMRGRPGHADGPMQPVS
jgi:hypothetical protein